MTVPTSVAELDLNFGARNKVCLTWLEGLSLGPSAIYVKPLGAQWQAGVCVSFPRGPGMQNVVIFWLEFRFLMIT